jgi:hypothetical protein
MSVSKRIIQHIIALNPCAFILFRASDFSSVPEFDKNFGGVKFSVNGPFHKGNVIIVWEWFDEYSVCFISKEGVIVKEYKNIPSYKIIAVLNFIEYGEESENY